MSYQVKPGSILGRVGAGVGKGLAEQIPKEIANQRLAKGLQQLGQNKENLSPLDQMAALYRAGADTSQVAQLAPIVQQSLQKQAFLNKGNVSQDQQGITAQPSAKTTTQEQVPIASIAKPPGALASRSDINNWKATKLQSPTFQDKENLARSLLERGIAQNRDEALTLADKELMGNYNASKDRIIDFTNDLDKRFRLLTQGNGIGDYKDVSGKIQQDLLDQGQYLVDEKGVAPEKASESAAKILSDLSNTSLQTKTTGAISNWFKPTKEKIRELKDQKKEFDKYGYGEYFDDIATAAVGITPMQTAAILDPIHNKELEKKLDKIKSHKPVYGTLLPPVPMPPIPQKELDEVILNIKKDDNLLAIAHAFRSKHLPVNQFFERLSQLEAEGKITLEDQQKRQREKPSSNSILGDVLFNLFR